MSEGKPASGTDQEYLRADQYRNASNLNARIALHERFSTNPYGWHRWVFDHLRLCPEARILELGCGAATLWRENGIRIPNGWEICLSDFSPGMVREAQGGLVGSGKEFAYLVLDAQAIPFPETSFDAVLANHMLFHVPDRAKALAEIRRVLRPGGRLYASTIGRAHMIELDERLREPAGEAISSTHRWGNPFTLENGQAQVSRWFSHVELHRYEDGLRVTEVEPLMDYLLSGSRKSLLVGERLAEFRRSLEHDIASQGTIRITKDSGLFEAW